jgi:hypothetical protein
MPAARQRSIASRSCVPASKSAGGKSPQEQARQHLADWGRQMQPPGRFLRRHVRGIDTEADMRRPGAAARSGRCSAGCSVMISLVGRLTPLSPRPSTRACRVLGSSII